MTLASSQLNLGAARRLTLPDNIAALQTGAPDDPIALLVPGYTGSKEDFGPILDPLAAAGLRAVAVDLPGQFESPPPATPSLAGGPPPGPDEAAGYAVDRLADTVLTLAGALGRPVHLLGHSFGGLVARAAVLRDPGAFTSLVLMDSGPAALTGARAARIEALRPYLAELGVPGVYDAMQQLDAAQSGWVEPPPELAAFLRRRFLAGPAAMLRGIGDALLAEPDRVDELARCGVRTLVLHGRDEDAWPQPLQSELAERLAAERVEIPAAAHSPAVENPAATAAALIRFWLPG